MHKPILRALCLLLACTIARAETGYPVAVRWWGQGMVSIETYWDLQLVLDPHRENTGYADPQLDADLVLVTHEHSDHNHVEMIAGDPVVVRGLDAAGAVRFISGHLDRRPNADRPSWSARGAGERATPHAVNVSSIAAWHDAEQGVQRGATAMFVIDVDGVRIVHCGDLGQRSLTDEQQDQLGRVDVLLLPVGGVYTIDGDQAADVVRAVRPRLVVPIHYKTPALRIELETADRFLAALGSEVEVVRAPGNTVAVSAAAKGSSAGKPRVALLGYEPWTPAGELADLLAAKEGSCRASEDVFRGLSAAQMNFQPANGTHTPRWNAEHMMGRELLFFTKAFAHVHPAFRPVDLNPQQMPDDYKAAHPTWNGAEEARQMARVRRFVRRFAFLLKDLDLDAPAWEKGWTLRFLCNRMVEHYNQHTANVQQKFTLPDWPSDE